MQKIANIRIDIRLIHGQVAAVWVNTLGINRIMVIDESAYNNATIKMVLKMACPNGVKLSILTPEKAAYNLGIDKYDGDNIMIVVKGPETLLKLWDAGFHFDTVNVGNMASSPDTKQVKRTVHVTPQNIADFHELANRGVKFTAQMTPGESFGDFIEAIDKL